MGEMIKMPKQDFTFAKYHYDQGHVVYWKSKDGFISYYYLYNAEKQDGSVALEETHALLYIYSCSCNLVLLIVRGSYWSMVNLI